MTAKTKLLIVDDDPDIRGMLTSLLSGTHDVLCAAGGDEAREILRRERPRLLLLDMTLPCMSGIELLRIARQIDPSLRILVLTSRAELELAKLALDLGAAAFVTKPFDPAALREDVDRLTGTANDAGSEGRPWRVAADARRS